MTVTDALDVLGIDLRPLRRWRKFPDKSHRIFKIATKRAFKRKALQTHPDRPGGDATLFREVAEANEILGLIGENDLVELVSEICPTRSAAASRAAAPVKPPSIEIKIEPRGSKVKITHICEFGIVTSFVSKVVGTTATKNEVDEWTQQIIKAMRSSGIVPNADTSAHIAEKLRRYYSESGYEFVGGR